VFVLAGNDPTCGVGGTTTGEPGDGSSAADSGDAGGTSSADAGTSDLDTSGHDTGNSGRGDGTDPADDCTCSSERGAPGPIGLLALLLAWAGRRRRLGHGPHAQADHHRSRS
jgi:uncharacterized protein (TIGR03382 family)